jgi:peptidoglycan/xylan/chitin deacetylase (PgdA/CDA1 family)
MRLLLVAVLSAPATAFAAPADVRRPILVSVDDLPIAGAMHESDESRGRTTDALLAALRRHGIRAVGLVIAGNVRSPADEALLQRWLDAGHELGSHSHRHLDYSAVSIAEYQADVDEAHARLSAFLTPRGKTLRFFRFPYLREGDTEEKLLAMRDWLAKRAQRNLPVTLDNQDWSHEQRWVAASRAGDEKVMDEVRQDYLAALRIAVKRQEAVSDELFGRSVPQILLLHANAVGGAHWDALFSWLEASGHRFAAADEVLADPAFDEPHADVARRGYGLWDRVARERRGRKAREQVASVLERQADAWNRGDFETFCSFYAADASFASPEGLARGRQAVLERYRRKYPDPVSRGTLSFDVLDSRLASGLESSVFGDAVPSRVHGVSILARWTLTRTGQPPASGLTLIVLRPRGEDWEIVQDASM